MQDLSKSRLIKEYMPHRLEWLASQNGQICLCVCTVAHFSWEKWLRYFVVTIWNKGLLATLPMEESWSRTNLPGINWWLFMLKKLALKNYKQISEVSGCLAFIGISRPYFAITNKTRVQGSKIRNKFKNSLCQWNPSFICYCEIRSRNANKG